MKANITYVHHSSYFVETGSASLLFDFAGGNMPVFSDGKPIYVFVSHAHEDHFTKEIFELAEQYPNVTYLLSSDIDANDVPELEEKAVFLAPGDKYADKNIKVETLTSTDQGIAFWVHVDGLDIYHAGDLNNWYWEGSKEDQDLEKAYHNELDKLAGRCADIAFVPVDPRLGDNFYRGVEDYMKISDALHLYPMHFWGDYSVIDKLKALPCTERYRDRIADITVEDQIFTI